MGLFLTATSSAIILYRCQASTSLVADPYRLCGHARCYVNRVKNRHEGLWECLRSTKGFLFGAEQTESIFTLYFGLQLSNCFSISRCTLLSRYHFPLQNLFYPLPFPISIRVREAFHTAIDERSSTLKQKTPAQISE